ncbi:MAG: AMP-binding protein [Planctomycetota bacterium]
MFTPLPIELSERFNLCEYFLDHNLTAGRGDKTAVIDGRGRYTYAQVSDMARRVAAFLRARGVRAEERVLIILPDAVEFAAAFFGVLRAGAVFAMVNPLLKAKDYEDYLDYTKARVVLTHSSVLPELQAAAEASPWCEALLAVDAPSGGMVFSWHDSLAQVDAHGPLAEMAATGPDDLAGWLFTSGSTGRPKGCVHVHRDFAYSTETYALQVAGYRESDVCVSVPKPFSDTPPAPT